MNLQDLDTVNKLVKQRNDLLLNIEHCKDRLGVTFFGQYQDEEIKAVARKALIPYFEFQIANIDAALEPFGVIP